MSIKLRNEEDAPNIKIKELCEFNDESEKKKRFMLQRNWK